MKKFMKGCAITALVLLVLGSAFAFVAGSAAGRNAISTVVDKVTGGRIQVNLDGLWDWGIAVGDHSLFNLEDSSMFDKKYDILSGNIDKFCLGNEIHELVVETGGCGFTTAPSQDGLFYLEVKDARKFQGYVEDGTLYVRSTVGGTNFFGGIDNSCGITLYLPENYRFRSVELEVGAGNLEFDGMNAQKAELEVGAGRIQLKSPRIQDASLSAGAGEIVLENMEITELEIEVGLGQCVAEGILNGNARIECSMGNVQVTLGGSQKDFNYSLSGAMGNITLGNNSYSGIAHGRDIDNGASKNMDVECSMGNISIRFQD